MKFNEHSKNSKNTDLHQQTNNIFLYHIIIDDPELHHNRISSTVHIALGSINKVIVYFIQLKIILYTTQNNHR